MTISGTIIELLTAPNPKLRLERQQLGKVTNSNQYENLRIDHVLDWPDFTYDNIAAAYGHLFGIGPLESDAVEDFDNCQGEIRKEAHVDKVVWGWNTKICRRPMKRGAAHVQEDLGLERCDITMQYLGAESKDLGRDGRSLAPDWSIFLRVPGAEPADESDDDPEARLVIVWGDSKCSSKWKSHQLDLPAQYRANWIWPFRQVLTYCVNEGTRYGFILTPEEVVVLRVYEDSSESLYPWRVQHAAIPWGNSGENVLTVNLALWALAVMGINEGHRPIRTLGQTLPLNVWWMDRGRRPNDPPTHEHHLSGAKVPHSQRPRGLDARPRPNTIPDLEAWREQHADDDGPRRSKRLRHH